MNRAILYLRVSRDEQVRGTSLDTQEASARDLCERVGYAVVAVPTEKRGAWLRRVVVSVKPYETGEGVTDKRRAPTPGVVVTLLSPDGVGRLVARATLSGDSVIVGEVRSG